MVMVTKVTKNKTQNGMDYFSVMGMGTGKNMNIVTDQENGTSKDYSLASKGPKSYDNSLGALLEAVERLKIHALEVKDEAPMLGDVKDGPGQEYSDDASEDKISPSPIIIPSRKPMTTPRSLPRPMKRPMKGRKEGGSMFRSMRTRKSKVGAKGPSRPTTITRQTCEQSQYLKLRVQYLSPVISMTLRFLKPPINQSMVLISGGENLSQFCHLNFHQPSLLTCLHRGLHLHLQLGIVLYLYP